MKSSESGSPDLPSSLFRGTNRSVGFDMQTAVEPLPDGNLRVTVTGGVKASRQKRPLHLLPFDALESIADVLDFGARKYAPRNWERGLSTTDLTRAAIGHLWDWMLRRNGGRDPETGLSHLAHAGCCVLFLIAHELRGLPDDRPDPVAEVPRPDMANWPAPKP